MSLKAVSCKQGKIKEKDLLPPGVPTFGEGLADALQVGVKFELCQQVAVNRNLAKADLIEGLEIVQGLRLIQYALEYDGMLYF